MTAHSPVAQTKVVTWSADEPPHALRALLHRLANPPSPYSPEVQAALDKLAPSELLPENKDKWL